MQGMAPQGRHSTGVVRAMTGLKIPPVVARASVFPVAACGESGFERNLWERWVRNYGMVAEEKEVACVTLYVHGGAHIFMNPGTHRILTSSISRSTNGPVLSLDYSLAPESPFPVAIFETILAYCALIGGKGTTGFATDFDGLFSNVYSKSRFRPDQIKIMGDSSGGCLVTQTLLVMKAVGGIPMPECAVLLSPFVDAS
ncbi:hypothetical protein HDU98_007654 [Podochytrium sp. JEL0797]|nr:hypothetical protein HDU98_007654 [Podochytrium sp. JEL0797]